MSFLSRFFTRPLTFIEFVSRDAFNIDLLHVFGGISVMPEDGPSHCIVRHSVIDLTTFKVFNGYQEVIDKFDIESDYVQKAMNIMAEKLNRELVITIKNEYEETEEEWLNDTEPEPEFKNLKAGCELPVIDVDNMSNAEFDTKRLQKITLVFRQSSNQGYEKFTVELFRSKLGSDKIEMKGLSDFSRFIVYLRTDNLIMSTYRKENHLGSGGMAFFILDAITGKLLHNGKLK